MKVNKSTIIVLALIMLFSGICYGVVKNTDESVGKNPITNINENRSQVLVSGEKYFLNSYQEKQYKKQQEKQRKQIQKKEREKPKNQFQDRIGQEISKDDKGDKGENSNGEQEKPETINPENPQEPDENSGPAIPQVPEEEADKSKLPTIITDLRDGERIAGLKLSFSLKAKDYRGYKIEAFYFEVRVNGEKISSSGANNYERKYKVDVANGENKVQITVKDKEGNKVTQNFTIYADKDGIKEVIGKVRVTIEAKSIGKGNILETGMTVDIYKDESIAEVTKRVLDNYGIGYTMKSSGYTGAYLSRIYKQGITDGFKIPSKLQNKLDEIGATEQSHKADSLGEFDFYRNSGWVCIFNDQYMETGTSNIDVVDGDEIRWGFTLNMGNEYQSTNKGGWREEVGIW